MRTFAMIPILALLSAAVPMDDTSNDLRAADAPFGLLACDWDCGVCGLGKHMVYNSPLGPGWGETEHGAHSCTQPGHCGGHQECQPQDEQLLSEAQELGAIAETVRLAVIANDARALRATVVALPGRVRVTEGAVQVVGCNSLVVAHFPIPSTLTQAIQ